MIVINVIILMLAIPFALFLEKLCHDELNDWRYRFKILTVISALIGIGLYFTRFEFKIPMIITLLFMIITFIALIIKAR